MWIEVDDTMYKETQKRKEKRDRRMLRNILLILLWMALAYVVFGPLGLIVCGIICVKKYL